MPIHHIARRTIANAQELLDAIYRSGLDVSLCRNCSKLVVCLPDGLSNWCEECAIKEGCR